MYNTFWTTLGKIVGIILLFAIGVALCGWVIMLLWNWLMPTIFNLTTITFWQALGIDALVSILFLPGITYNTNNKNNNDWY